MTLENGERQVAKTLDGIRADHRFRYEWAVKQLKPGSRVLDLACGVGYGAKILADAGHTVVAVDRSEEAIGFAKEHYAHDRITHIVAAADSTLYGGANDFDAVVCFETIEHIEDPRPELKAFSRLAPLLLASVPNESRFPHGGRILFHHRHYKPHEFKELIETSGFVVKDWYGQEGKESDVEPGMMGRTIIVRAERGTAAAAPKPLEPAESETGEAVTAGPKPPEHISIVALGPSSQHYVEVIKGIGGRHAFCDEVWAINAMGNVVDCDRIFHMDDVRIQELRAIARPKGNIANMLKWMRLHPGPIYTSRVHSDYPGLVEYPLEAVINDFGYDYFNNTVSYAVALAIHIGVKKITFWGIDFSYEHSHHAEKGRANVEYWIGRAMERGIKIATTPKSTLLDACVPRSERLYGYDTLHVDFAEQPDRSLKVSFKPRETIPTAEEVESRYDHSLPTVPEDMIGAE